MIELRQDFRKSQLRKEFKQDRAKHKLMPIALSMYGQSVCCIHLQRAWVSCNLVKKVMPKDSTDWVTPKFLCGIRIW